MHNLRPPNALRLLLCASMLLASGCSSMGARYLKLGLPVVYENAEMLIGWQADDYLDLSREQREWLDAQVATQKSWHRNTQLPKYAATMAELARLAGQRNITASDLQRVEFAVRAYSDDVSLQGLRVAGQLFARLSDAQIVYFHDRLEELNAKTAEDAADLTAREKRERLREQIVDRYEDMLGDLSGTQLQAVDRLVAASISEDQYRPAYWRRWQSEFFALLAQRRAAPECFVTQFIRLAMTRERWYTPELRRAREQNAQLQRELAINLLTSLSATQRAYFARRAGEWSSLFADLASKPSNAVAQLQSAARDDACRDTAMAAHGVVAAGS